MALRACLSFDAYATAQMNDDWTVNNSGFASIGAVGRNSTNGMTTSRPTAGVVRLLDAQSTWIIGFAFKVDTQSGSNEIVLVIDGAIIHVSLVLDSSRVLRVYRGAQTTLLATGTTTLLTGTFYYLEFKVLISDTVGTIDVRINGVAETLTFASGSNGSQDTRNAGNATADRVTLGGNSNPNNIIVYRWDDAYICDGTGSSPTNTFLGDVRVQAIFPSGDGNSSQFVGSDGNSTNNSLLVDETAPNDDTDYVESATATNKDTYAYGNVTPTSGTVYGVRPMLRAKKTDAGTRKVVSIARLSSTEVDSAESSLSTDYLYYSDIREAKPGGGVWTISDVNSAEFGVKVST